MKHLFIPNEKGTHLKDGVRGDLRSFADTVKIHSPHPVLATTDGITLFDPPVVKPMRSITKNELADRINALGKAAQFLALISNLSPADRLKWDATPTVSPDYPFIKENRATILAVLGINSDQLDNVFR